MAPEIISKAPFFCSIIILSVVIKLDSLEIRARSVMLLGSDSTFSRRDID
ncbi:hypothetical protein HYZ97_03660 [Candidatus Pacearchaeota archaeon]|nr:hypothetical protein [Candidatus Pacearchaeota archaeon]